MKFKRSKWTWVVSIILVAVLSWSFSPQSDKYFQIAKNLDIFATLFKEVNAYYVDDVNPNQLIRTGIDAMLKSLDPYTNFIPEDDIEDYRTMTTGEYGGIGAIIGKNNGTNMILMPYEGYPAYNSGLQIADEIVAIDGIDVTNKSTSEISKLLKGQANTNVTITIKRYGVDDTKDVDITRKKITIDNVPYYGMVRDGIGYIKLSDFTTGASREVSNALKKLKSDGADKIILDLRGNPGGLLVEAVNVTNIFIPEGREVVSTKGKREDWNQTRKTLNTPVDTEIPLVVLTNNRSASASEIVSGVVQDYDRGVLVGDKTFGKGLVQATRQLSYNAQLKITTAKYYIPSGRCIQAIDYANRNEDGSVGKIPDSLKSEFTTENGRVVYDGGGIKPDIQVDGKQYAPITISLISKGLLFDYATMYRHKHEEIKDGKRFSISEDEYEAFKDWLSDKEYDYTTDVEQNIQDLINSAKKEKYYEEIEGQIEDLQKETTHNKENDLNRFSEEIIEALEEEIVSRYYFQKGMIESSFDDDEDIEAAVNALKDTSKYNSILTGSM